MRRLLVVLLLALFASSRPTVNAQNPTPPATEPAPVLKLTGVITPIHDPTLIKDGDTSYVFATGQVIPDPLLQRQGEMGHLWPGF